MYNIVKIDNNKNSTFLYKTYRNKYMFSTSPNVFFNTEEEATNFLYYNYSYLKPLVEDDDILITRYYEGDKDD